MKSLIWDTVVLLRTSSSAKYKNLEMVTIFKSFNSIYFILKSYIIFLIFVNYNFCIFLIGTHETLF